MMGVGEFAQATGLTVKALHLYHERKVLVPAAVDARSGYRWYAAAQLREALLLKALRQAGVPLADLAAGPVTERFTALLERQLARRDAERRAQDAAAAAAVALYRQVTDGWQVERRRAPAVRYAAAVLALPVQDTGNDTREDMGDNAGGNAGDNAGENADELVGTVLTELWEVLDAAGNPPVGPFWLSFGAPADGPAPAPRAPGARLLACCWPVAQLPAPGDPAEIPLAGGARASFGVLPERDELFLRWPQPGPGNANDTAGAHPALAALLEAAEAEEDIVPARLRQVTFMGEDGGPGGVELSYTLDTPLETPWR